MTGEGAASLIAVIEPVLSGCCREMKKLFVNRFGKTRCVPCDAEAVAARALGPQLAALVMVLTLLFFAGCGAPAAEIACIGPRPYACESDCVVFCESSNNDDSGVFAISYTGCEPSCWNRADGGAR